MSRPAVRSCGPPLRRGSIYVAVLGTAVLVVIIGLSALTLVRVQRRDAEQVYELAQARLHARSAIELGLLAIANDANWRSSRGGGMWFTDKPLGTGRFSLKVEDPRDGDVTNAICDPVLLTACGYQGQARQMLQVKLESEAERSDPVGAAIAALDPLAWWRLDESQGTVAGDSAFRRSGIYRNGVALGVETPFSCNTAARFDGSNDHVEIPHTAAFLLDEGTVQFWFKTNWTTTQGLFGKDSLGFDTGGHLTIAIVVGYLYARLQSTSANYELWGPAISTQQWYHVAFTFGQSGMTLYVNGTAVAYNAYTGGLGGTSGGSGNYEPIGIGVGTWDTGDQTLSGWSSPFKGVIDEVAIFSRPLSATEVLTLYQASTAAAPYRMRPVAGCWQRAVAP